MTGVLNPPPVAALGRYSLAHLLGHGGMGEVYLAKLTGTAGFEKLCVVKTVLPHLSSDKQFLDRFRHEGKILVQLLHANIAQVLDMGEVDGTCFIALEYVPGIDVAHICERSREANSPVPVSMALYVGARVAEALGYAHRKTGPDGRPLGVVHRDVSPQNVMVSYEGEVKIIDFGLAKSTARSKLTQPSTVLGKMGYMSPEQARAESVDWRSDIYSCGIVVWEMLAGRLLFDAGTVGEMVAAMANPHYHSLADLRAGIDPAVDRTVQKALAPDPANRYARCDDFARALTEQLVRLGASIGGEEVGTWVRALCPHEYSAQRKLLSLISAVGVDSTQPSAKNPGSGLLSEPTATRSPKPASGTPVGATYVRPSEPGVPAGATSTPTRRSQAPAPAVGPSAATAKRARGPLVPAIIGGLVGAAVLVAVVVFARADLIGGDPRQQQRPTEPPRAGALPEPQSTTTATPQPPTPPSPAAKPPEKEPVAAPPHPETPPAPVEPTTASVPKRATALAPKVAGATEVAEIFLDEEKYFLRAGSASRVTRDTPIAVVTARATDGRPAGSAKVTKVYSKMAELQLDKPAAAAATQQLVWGRFSPRGPAPRPPPMATTVEPPPVEPVAPDAPPPAERAAAGATQPSVDARASLQGRARFDGKSVFVYNETPAQWTDCEFRLNDGRVARKLRVGANTYQGVRMRDFDSSAAIPGTPAKSVTVQCAEGIGTFTLGNSAL